MKENKIKSWKIKNGKEVTEDFIITKEQKIRYNRNIESHK